VAGVNLVAAGSPRTRLLIIGCLAFAAVIASWVVFDVLTGADGGTHAVDLTVYRDGGLIVRNALPGYHPHTSTPLYSWGGYTALALKFTYPPFAAVAFAPLSYLSMGHLLAFSIVVNMLALPVALWFTFGALGERYRDWRVRLGATLLAAAVTFWLQPEVRTIYLGQVNLVLMAMIMWDLCQPSKGRWWKGFLTGIAAGIKLTPLIFIPYLLVTKKYREAAATVAGFLFTVVVGFIFLPGDSARWWLPPHLLIVKDGTRTGFIGWAGNQSLRAIISRFAGSVNAGQDPWLAAALVATVIGLFGAYQFERRGHHVVAILVTALTGLLDSPVSWDHHWVWVALGATVAVHYAITYWRTARARARWFIALAVGVVFVYGPWPDALWETGRNLGKFSLGFLWAPPNTNPELYTLHGDQPSFVEYHWHGIWLLTGNAYILGGIALMLLAGGVAWRLRKTRVSSVTAPQEEKTANIVTT
jgi:alpha-1,2-mannosyltransferase